MKKEYDFSKGKKKPYIVDLKKQIIIKSEKGAGSRLKSIAG